MNIRIFAALAAIVMLGGVSAQAADESFESQLQEVEVMTIAPEATLIGANGVNGNSSWREIERKGLTVKQPMISIGSASYSIGMFCKDGNALRTIKPVRRCTDWNYGKNEDRCEAWTSGILSTPITGKAQHCAKWQETRNDRVCTSWQTYTKTIPLSYEIKVVRRSGKNDDETALFTKQYTVPSCK